MKVIQWGMTATVVNNTVTLTQGAPGECLPGHMAMSEIVITTAANPALEWKPAAVGIKYRVTIEQES